MVRCLLYLLPLLLFPQSLFGQSVATYSVDFVSTWSASTHPDDFPSGAHYSPLKGVTHDATVQFWDEGQLASPGIESMAETGNNATLDSEMSSAVSGGSAEFIVNGPGMNVSPGTASVTFDISSDKSLFSIVSMIAPSPDWFVGINGVDLYKGNQWADTLTVVAYVYDAGTDDGATYTAPDAESNPHTDIVRIEQSPFQYSGVVEPVGYFSFSLVSVLSADDQPDGRTSLSRAFPNPFTQSTTITLRNAPSHSATLEVFDLTGRAIRQVTLSSAGDQTDFTLDGTDLPSGIYLYRVSAGSFVRSGVAVLAR